MNYNYDRKEADYIRIPRERLEKCYIEVKEKYLSGIGLSALCKEYDLPRKRIEKVLSADGVSLRTVKNCHNEISKNKAKNTFLTKYGVDNVAKLDSMKDHLREINKQNKDVWQGKCELLMWVRGRGVHPKDKINFKEYKALCLSMTNNNKSKMIDTSSCFYTNIKFNDRKYNSWNSKSIDHKISILGGFQLGMTPDEIGDVNNLVYCLRLVNSVKRELSSEEFVSSGMIEKIKYANQTNQFSC